MIRGEFGAGRLSYAKVRALTRIATPDTEAGLAEIAAPMTANQLERFARAHRRVSQADDAGARVRRRLAWRFEDDGSLSGTFHLPPLPGAVLLKALRAAAGDLEHPHRTGPQHRPGGQEPDVSAETPAAGQAPAGDRLEPPTSSGLADALLIIAEAFLAAKVAAADDPEVYHVVVHVGTDAITTPARPAASPGDVPAETPAAPTQAPGHPAVPAPSGHPADPARCRFPGCESRRVDLHHIQYWSNGGRTALDRPDGTALPSSPPLPPAGGTIEDCHDADISAETIIPAWYGERLDLDYAIWVCFAGAAGAAGAAGQPARQPDGGGGAPLG